MSYTEGTPEKVTHVSIENTLALSRKKKDAVQEVLEMTLILQPEEVTKKSFLD